jgi:hypothetical protein
LSFNPVQEKTMSEEKPVDHPVLKALVYVLLILFCLGMALANHREFFDDLSKKQDRDEERCVLQGSYGIKGENGVCHVGGTR